MTQKIFRTIALTAVCAVLVASLLLVLTLHASYETRISRELRNEAELIAHAIEQVEDGQAYLDGLTTPNRVTLIATDGTVVFDSFADAARLDNHAQRPEVLSALQNGVGESMRYSDTLTEATLYYAHRTQDGSVVRIASTRASSFGMVLDVLPEILGMLLIVILLSLLVARKSSKRIIAPLNALNLDHPLENEAYDELAPLLTRMDHQHAQIRRQMDDLERARTETAAIMENMREGLVLLDRQNRVLSMNASAATVFGVPKAAQDDLLNVCRDASVSSIVRDAQEGRSSDALFEKDGRTYHLCASPVRQDCLKGAVLLILDVTEHFAAEISRREFSANVSHELKTPLTTISGYAEMIRDGIARQEDIPFFAGKIHGEALRLLALINDILQLSRLDEKQSWAEKETVALLPMLRALAEDFLPAAHEKGLTLHLNGENADVQGYPSLLREMLQNLIDNAVKYTPVGGKVDISLRTENGRVCCAVRDTGIGIPKEHHAHVFERFYRVDKSHSRATGGTGLGLAIVKHVADVHHAVVELDSEMGKGTEMSVYFIAGT